MANSLSRFMLSYWAMGVFVCVVVPFLWGCVSHRYVRAVVECPCGRAVCVLVTVMCGVFVFLVWGASVILVCSWCGGEFQGLSFEEVISWAIFLFVRNAVISLMFWNIGDVLRTYFHSLTVSWAQGEYVMIMGRVGPFGGVFLWRLSLFHVSSFALRNLRLL